ncbi:MAG: hypothetical protein ACOX4F_02550 [Atopobiaceae bacterium]|jgi:hypothetical protein
MKVTLVYNDGVIDSFETAQDSFHSTSHARLSTFVEEANADYDGDDEKRTVTNLMGLEITPIADRTDDGYPIRPRRIVEIQFDSDHVHHAVPSVEKVCEHTDGLEKLIVDGVVVWEGDPGIYLADDAFDEVSYD